MIELARRSFITGLIALVAAPAIVRAGSIMPVKVVDPWATLNDEQIVALLNERIDHANELMAEHVKVNIDRVLYGDGTDPRAGLNALLEPDVYTRYAGYDPVCWDATKRHYLSQDERRTQAAAQSRAELAALLHG